VRQNAFQVGSYVSSGISDCLDPLHLSPSVTTQIRLGSRFEVVCDAIHLDRDAGGLAEEVEHKRPKGMLLPELQAFGSQTKHSPKPDLGRAHSFSKLARLMAGHV
jgi:hypothetical protein